MRSIVIACIKSWNINYAKSFKERNSQYKVNIITNPQNLELKRLENINPEYIFFPHWSWKVIPEIYEKYQCIGFHITDLPYGRGGSPLQNLIIRGQYQTHITAFKMIKGWDAGPIYYKKPFDMNLGSAEELLILSSKIVFFEMMTYILENNPQSVEQKGDEFFFKRRKPEESDLSQVSLVTLEKLYDFVRMLDGEGYPKAFLKLNSQFRILFSEVHKKSNKLVGRFEIISQEKY